MIQTMFSNDTVFVAMDGISYAELDGEAVILNVNSGQYYGLNEVGASIMQQLQNPVSLISLKQQLLEEFDVDEHLLEEDIMAFLNAMTQHELIRVTDESNVQK